MRETKEFIETVLNIKNQLPPLLAELLMWLIGLILILAAVYFLVKLFLTKEIQSFVLFLKQALSVISSQLKEGINDPIKYPKLELVGIFILVVQSYLMAVLFASFLIAVVILVFDQWNSMNFYKKVAFQAFILFFMYMIMYFKTQGNKDRLTLKSKLQDKEKYPTNQSSDFKEAFNAVKWRRLCLLFSPLAYYLAQNQHNWN